MFKFAEKNWVIYSVKCFCEVNKNATGKATFIKGESNQLSEAGKGMLSWMFSSKTKLEFLYAIVKFQKWIKSWIY